MRYISEAEVKNMESMKLLKVNKSNYFTVGCGSFHDFKNTIRVRYDGILNIIDDNNMYSSNKYVWNKEKISNKSIIFELNFKNTKIDFKEAQNLIKYIIKIGKRVDRKNIGIKKNKIKLIGNLIYGESIYEQDIICAVGVLLCKNKNQKYEYLYDKICENFDRRVISKNVCDFKENKCIAKRNTSCTMGCCHHFKNKYFGILYEKDMQLCEYQKNNTCIAKCISCKMYMCNYLKKRGYNFNCNNTLLIKLYFNLIQKIIIKSSFFTSKNIILKRLVIFG
jgi:hypothetical protein